jgi:hypothetical protein
MEAAYVNKHLLTGLLLLVGLSICLMIGSVILTVQRDVAEQVPAEAGRPQYKVVSTQDLKNADPNILLLKANYPYLSVDWGIAPSNLAWTTLNVELPNDSDAASALAFAFANRTCDITTSLAPHLEPMAELWLKSDRRNPIEQVHGDWAVSIDGFEESGTLRMKVAIGWPEQIEK